MTSRYTNTKMFRNNLPMYENILEERATTEIAQYQTTRFKHLNESQKASIYEKEYSWQVGDRLEKISSRMYDNHQYWWIIARYNNKPTDAHYERGDVVKIPMPLSLILSYYTE